MKKWIYYLVQRFKIINGNNKTIVSNILGSFLVKGGSLVVSLFTLPAYLRFFNNQQILGLWFTLVSALSWILTFDLGIGNGLRNHLVISLAKRDYLKAKEYITSAYVSTGITILLVSIISAVLFRFVNWNVFFNISVEVISNRILYIAASIVFFGILIQFFLKLITSILYALQKSALVNLVNLLSSIIILIYVSLAKSSDISTNLISMSIVNSLSMTIPLLTISIFVFSKSLKRSIPNIKFFNIASAKEVMKMGGSFFWVQIMFLLITGTNEVLITLLTDSTKVVEYQVYSKLFMLVGSIFLLSLSPIWSAITKALAEKNYTWIQSLYRIMKFSAILAVICEVCIIPFLQFGFNIWLGKNAIQVNYLYAIIFAISGSIFIWNGVISSIANGIGELRIQKIFFTIGAIINIPLSMIFVVLFRSWIGVVVANIISMSIYCIIQPIWLNSYFKNLNHDSI